MLGRIFDIIGMAIESSMNAAKQRVNRFRARASRGELVPSELSEAAKLEQLRALAARENLRYPPKSDK